MKIRKRFAHKMLTQPPGPGRTENRLFRADKSQLNRSTEGESELGNKFIVFFPTSFLPSLSLSLFIFSRFIWNASAAFRRTAERLRSSDLEVQV